MKNKVFALLLTVFCALFFSGQAKADDKISVVADQTYAPFEFKDSDQTYKGIDVDILKKVAEIEGWDYNVSYVGFDAAVNAVQSGQADAIMAGMTVTEARKKVFTMSDTYYDTSIVIATTKSNKVSKYSQLKGKTVGVKNGTAASTWLDNHKKEYGYTVKTYDTGDDMYNSLAAGSVYAVMDDKAVIQYAINQGQDLNLSMKGESIGSFAFGVKKGSKYEYLVTQFNDALAKMKADGSLSAIIEKWTGEKQASATTTATSASTAEATTAKATPKKSSYTIVTDSSFAPFEYQNDQGNYVGIDIELIKAIAKQQGFTIKLSHPGFDAALNAVQTGQADGAIAGMTITDERKQTFDFSEPYYTSQIELAVKKGSKITSYEDLKGKKVGAKTGTSSYLWLKDHADQYGYTLKTYDDASSLYDSLNSNSVQAIMDDKAVLDYAIKEGRSFETPIAGIDTGNLGFAVRKGSNSELIEMFNNGLAALKANGEYDKIIAKYTSANETSSDNTVDESTFVGLIQNNYKQLLSGLWITIQLALLSFAIALIIGILIGMMSVSPFKSLRIIASVFVDVVRGIPLMIVAAFIFWGIPNVLQQMTGSQVTINEFVAGVIALSLNSGAYIAEIVRGGIEAVPKGQMEASRSLGISYVTTMRRIIVPQALRLMLPNFINQFVITLKDTTIIAAIGLVELFQTGKIIIARNYQSFKIYAILAIVYLVMITLLTRLAKLLEKRFK
ncbi:ABC transporter substrate-binding protein/permease [Streptococcus sp. DD12]|uniref:ABC transporter substrate-binding protein/permease n=1 Tax=Streptococcus sp. DD12 TaxID=1777880 RepID=UPI0007993072|nr:ABC transporter substrate-binding protein/permease [Streptococcus sp. DD12]KXT76450.1 Glutamine ABC transporter, glutamine-binding protein/permease protein [Streptococcus sp. DD12]